MGCAVAVDKSGGTCSDVRVGFSGVGHVGFRDSNVEGALKGQALSAAVSKLLPIQRPMVWMCSAIGLLVRTIAVQCLGSMRVVP